ncbi:hypothetical protein B296_00052049 [Ensete ventricosum]|uniref:Uncharacterized protein n=1 Tax=Ensete ventricosum TaxID=4639 RepID=A0A426XVB2_ENSVE|nr:hypothetical protein B296_00052049 [Ensete ventricosum]
MERKVLPHPTKSHGDGRKSCSGFGSSAFRIRSPPLAHWKSIPANLEGTLMAERIGMRRKRLRGGVDAWSLWSYSRPKSVAMFRGELLILGREISFGQPP